MPVRASRRHEGPLQREEEKERGVLELISVEARELRGLRKRERKKKRGGLEPTFLEARELTRSGFYGLLMDQSAT